ncbi:MAG: acylneuraminate cytidylyltransferase family protein [Magnetospirillum sp. WYHS-4]
MNGQVVAFIFARGGSKGLPGKHHRLVAGKPLIQHAVEQAKAARLVERVMVSSDDPSIAEAAKAYGAEMPFLRPAHLARDETPEWLAWRHAIETLGETVGLFVSVPATAPLRRPADIDACIERFRMGDVDVVCAVAPAHRSPYFNMVKLDAAGHAGLVIPPATGTLHRRQDAPPVFDMTTICYVADPAFVLKAGGLFDGRVGTVEVPPERAVDIDTEYDLRVADALYPLVAKDAP